MNFKFADIYCVTEKIRKSHGIEVNKHYFSNEEQADSFKHCTKEKVRVIIFEDEKIYLLGKPIDLVS